MHPNCTQGHRWPCPVGEFSSGLPGSLLPATLRQVTHQLVLAKRGGPSGPPSSFSLCSRVWGGALALSWAGGHFSALHLWLRGAPGLEGPRWSDFRSRVPAAAPGSSAHTQGPAWETFGPQHPAALSHLRPGTQRLAC